MLVGKPDSIQRVFSRSVQIDQNSLFELNLRVHEKLKTHNLEAIVVSATVIFDDKTTIEFGGWAEFESYRWSTHKATKEIRLKWQFLLSVQGYEIPQQHSLVVKLSADAKPLELLQAVLSKNPDEIDGVMYNFAPTVCRADFVNHTMGQELISLVEEWNKSLSTPDIESSIIKKLYRYKHTLSHAINYLTPALSTIAFIAVFRSNYITSDHSLPISMNDGVNLITWLLFGIVVIYLLDKSARWLAGIVHNSIAEYGKYSIFNLTSGDLSRAKKLDNSNKAKRNHFLLSVVFSLALNIISGIITATYWPNGIK
ncbi:MAG: hypothetical protein E6Q68_00535 [Polynucleobacter sp.]|nr:MAG: hypothetical protein E6Q68_00535 [Polynucleobacter sp.]